MPALCGSLEPVGKICFEIYDVDLIHVKVCFRLSIAILGIQMTFNLGCIGPLIPGGGLDIQWKKETSNYHMFISGVAGDSGDLGKRGD